MLIIMFILFRSSTALVAHAVEAPEGFRGIKFGTDLSTIKGFHWKRQTGLVGLRLATSYDVESRYLYWKKRGEKLTVGNIKCIGIEYRTFNNKLIGGDISFSIDSHDLIMESLIEMYGEPSPKTHPTVIFTDWDLGDVSVRLARWDSPNWRGSIRLYCLLSFDSRILSKEQRAYHLRLDKNRKDKEEQEKNKAEQEKKQKIDSFKKDL